MLPSGGEEQGTGPWLGTIVGVRGLLSSIDFAMCRVPVSIFQRVSGTPSFDVFCHSLVRNGVLSP